MWLGPFKARRQAATTTSTPLGLLISLPVVVGQSSFASKGALQAALAETMAAQDCAALDEAVRDARSTGMAQAAFMLESGESGSSVVAAASAWLMPRRRSQLACLKRSLTDHRPLAESASPSGESPHVACASTVAGERNHPPNPPCVLSHVDEEVKVSGALIHWTSVGVTVNRGTCGIQ